MDRPQEAMKKTKCVARICAQPPILERSKDEPQRRDLSPLIVHNDQKAFSKRSDWLNFTDPPARRRLPRKIENKKARESLKSWCRSSESQASSPGRVGQRNAGIAG